APSHSRFVLLCHSDFVILSSFVIRHSSFRATWFWPAVIALAAWLAVLATLDPCGDHPRLPRRPGVPAAGPFNVGQGTALADRLLDRDLAGFRKLDALLPDHPPLGRVWIGLWHELAFLIAPPIDRKVPYSVTCARTGPAAAFALLA